MAFTINTGDAVSALTTFRLTVKADHAALGTLQERYHGETPGSRRLVTDLVQRVGFQILVAVRIMRLVRDLHVPFGPQIVSRLIRHLYAAEVHWNAELAPGMALVHGNGLVISHGAAVGPGCIVFQGVTLGESIDPVTRQVGAPTIGRNVHIGPNSVLLGPISVGDGTKIMANVTLVESVPAGCVVRSSAPVITERQLSDSPPHSPSARFPK